jgi:hypothetical protein
MSARPSKTRSPTWPAFIMNTSRKVCLWVLRVPLITWNYGTLRSFRVHARHGQRRFRR